jgi:hypothetical protein
VRLVRHPEKHQGRVWSYLHGKSVSDCPSCSEEEARRIKQGAHSYRRREVATRRDPQREADIVVETLNKYQSSD